MDLKNYLFEHDEFVYFRLQLPIWVSNYLKNPNTLTIKAIELITDVYINFKPNLPLVINCSRVTEINQKVFDNFIIETFAKSKRPIIFYDCKDIFSILKLCFDFNIIKSAYNLDSDYFKNFVVSDYSDYIIIYNYANAYTPPNGFIDLLKEFEQNNLINIIKESYEKYETPLRLKSTPVKAAGEFETARILNYPKYFIHTSLLLADELDNIKVVKAKTKKILQPLKLIAVSLRSAPFASAIALLTNTGYDVLDHLGPKHKLWDIEILDHFESGVNYIYFGDFLIGGTEFKIAQTYCRLYNCPMDFALVIGSLLPQDAFGQDLELSYLIKLTDPKLEELKINFSLMDNA